MRKPLITYLLLLCFAFALIPGAAFAANVDRTSTDTTGEVTVVQLFFAKVNQYYNYVYDSVESAKDAMIAEIGIESGQPFFTKANLCVMYIHDSVGDYIRSFLFPSPQP